MKRIGLLTGIILLISIAACNNIEESENDGNAFLITYERNSGWVQYSYVATIDENGKMKVSESARLSDKERDSEYVIAGTKVALLKEKLESLLTIGISDKYGFGTNAPTDLPTRKIKYETSLKKDSTCIYFPAENEMPDELTQFVQTLEQIISESDTEKDQ